MIVQNAQPAPTLIKMAYPSHPLARAFFKFPILLWRMGFGPLVGRIFVILTTWGRKSGLPRHTAVEYHTFRGRTYVLAAWPQSDWYLNLQANPALTIQTAAGVEHVKARRLVEDEELAEVFEFMEGHPGLRTFWKLLGFDLSKDAFLQHKDQLHLLTFDPTDTPTPKPLEVDLPWVPPLVLLSLLLGWVWGFLVGRKRK